MNINTHKHQLISQTSNATSLRRSESKEKNIFGSRVDRFTFEVKDTPGPGTYEYIARQKHTLDYRISKNKQNDVANQHQWILSKGRLSIPTSNINIGPGLYHQDGIPSNSAHSSWAKKERFNESKSFNNVLGPGQYQNNEPQTNIKDKLGALSVFKSRSPRSFFDEIIQKQRKQIKDNNPEDEQNELVEEIVKFDETSYPIRRKADKLSPVFLSKCVRPQLINQHSPEKLGPGSYSLTLERNQPQKSATILSAMHYNIAPLINDKKLTILTSKISPPGPGAYITPNSAQAVRKPYGIIPKQERFKGNQSLNQNKIPGPGQYMQNRYTMVKEEDVILNKYTINKKAQKMHDFGTVARVTLKNHSEAPFGEYNVQLFDMNYKLQKQKQHYQKLRMMEVTLPAFNSKQHHN